MLAVYAAVFFFFKWWLNYQNSIVGIMTHYGLDCPQFKIPVGVRCSGPVQTSLEALPVSCTMGTGSLSQSKVVGKWNWPFSAGVGCGWSYASSSHLSLLGMLKREIKPVSVCCLSTFILSFSLFHTFQFSAPQHIGCLAWKMFSVKGDEDSTYRLVIGCLLENCDFRDTEGHRSIKLRWTFRRWILRMWGTWNSFRTLSQSKLHWLQQCWHWAVWGVVLW